MAAEEIHKGRRISVFIIKSNAVLHSGVLVIPLCYVWAKHGVVELIRRIGRCSLHGYVPINNNNQVVWLVPIKKKFYPFIVPFSCRSAVCSTIHPDFALSCQKFLHDM